MKRLLLIALSVLLVTALFIGCTGPGAGSDDEIRIESIMSFQVE